MIPILVAALCVSPVAYGLGTAKHAPAFQAETVSEELLSRCEERWFETDLDHFSRSKGPGGVESFPLRYYVCSDEHKRPESGPPGPIFFYLGNESDVQLYLNATGLMWENARPFGAMLIFAEHRYYGESLPFGDDTYKRENMAWLSTEQAMADYAALLFEFKRNESLADAPVIGFGGSYGGMLATWARLKYPHVWQGAIAGSAPIWTFEGETPPMDPLFYSKTVTFDTSVAAGAAPGCTDALRSAFGVLTDAVNSGSNIVKHGLEGAMSLHDISAALDICPERALNTSADVAAVRDWASAAFDMMAMGSYPYASSYMLNGNGMLPPFPVRVACSEMMTTLAEDAMQHTEELAVVDGERADMSHVGKADADALLRGLRAAAAVWYNYTGDVECNNPWKGVNKETQLVGNLWDYQYCTEMYMPMAKSGIADIYWSEPWNEKAARQACKDNWGVEPRATWGTVEWGGHDLRSLSNVVFSNGLFDPWHLGGVLTDLSPSVKAVIIPEGGHHLDLMFSNSADPASVRRARRTQVANIQAWIHEFHAHRSPRDL